MQVKENILLKSLKLGNGETLGYRESGSGGVTLLLIHGNMSSSKHWDTFISGFPEGYKIYAVDLRGFGTSSYINPVDSLKAFSEDVRLFTDALNLKNFVLAGWSMGGAVAMQFASDYPGCVSALILLESVGVKGYPLFKRDENGQPIKGEFLKTKKEIAEDLHIRLVQQAYNTKNREYLRKVWNTLIYTHHQPSPDKYEEYLEDMLTQRNLADVYYALGHFNISHQHNGIAEGTGDADKIAAPTLVIHGDRDLVIPAKTAEETAAAIGDNAELVVLEDTGHSPPVDCLDKLISLFVEFIKQGGDVTPPYQY